MAIMMILALAMILFGAELFTNAIEWLGRKWHLGQGAVGSVLAALGTALPETAVPVTAIVAGKGSLRAQDVGIGGILGAPFLLITLGSFIMAISLLLIRRRGSAPKLNVYGRSYRRDMTVFLLAFAVVTLTGCVPNPWLHKAAPIFLIGIYITFLVLTLRDKVNIDSDGELHPLYLQGKAEIPGMLQVWLQLTVALALIVGGAHLLSGSAEQVSVWLNIPTFVVSALLIPLATELPETLNSVVWIRQGKDALASGNITGAMVFQSTLVPALGIWMTPWNLNQEALLTAGLTLAAATFIFGMFQMQGQVKSSVLMTASLLYWILPMQAIVTRYDLHVAYWLGFAGFGIILLLSFGIGTRYRSL
ncbi:sodium:calcium antiporter [Alicyclobacillus sp. SO9]|uniref:sodium:calcium antiporter n=1 Tax=Alicyclobacillus sp. SO9 TaxID=2665646 RepID=UPI001E545963|nr:sodium:calcium antiporter [Alicyclobacillus sp. SO9]